MNKWPNPIDPWLDEIKQWDDVTLYELTSANRDSVPEALIEILREEAGVGCSKRKQIQEMQ